MDTTTKFLGTFFPANGSVDLLQLETTYTKTRERKVRRSEKKEKTTAQRRKTKPVAEHMVISFLDIC